MPLASVKAGMNCKALSVIRGTAPSEFSAKVLDVIRGDPTAAGSRILVQVSGPAVDATGVGSGFSGSPVYCTGADKVRRNAGAISETVGSFGNKVVLVTPIEQILGEAPDAPRAARSAPALLRAAMPLATPLTVAGLSPSLREGLTRAAAKAKRIVLATPGGPLAGAAPVDLRPGAAVAAGSASGDITVGAIGTVAYRDGSALWAFGHALDAAGARALPLLDAYVYGVIDNPLGTEDAISYKLASPGRPAGTFSNDTLSAIVGRLGAQPRTIPLSVDARDLDTGRTRQVATQVTDERDLELGSGLDLVSALALAQAGDSVLRSSPPRLTLSMCVRIVVAERAKPLGFCNRYFEGGRPFDDLSAAMGLIDGFKFGPLTPRSVTVRTAISRGVREEFIVSAKAPRRVRPGARIPIRLVLQRRRGGRRRVTFRYRVPRSTRAGNRTLTLRGTVPASLAEGAEDSIELVLEGDGGSTSGGDGSGDDPGPTSIAALSRAVAALGRRDGLRATFAARSRGPIVLRPAGLVRGKVEMPIKVLRRARRR